MLRFIQMIFLALVAGPAEVSAEALASERWRLHSLNRSLDGFTVPWDGLNQDLLAGHPMLDSRFVDSMLRHFGDGSEKLCELERDGKPAGALILRPEKPGVWTSFLPGQAQVAPMILAEPAGLSRLLPSIPGLVGQVDLLCQDPDFSPAFECGEIPHRRQPHALTMSVSLQGDFDSYWAQRPKNLRASLRTRENRLARDGLEPRLVRLERPDEMRGAVERFAALEQAGWKGREGTAVGRGDAQSRFYTEVMEKFAGTGQAVAYEYWLGGRLAASQLAISTGPMLVLLKTSYDEELAQYSPGRLLLREVIRDGFSRNPGGIIEFYTNANQDQLAWATEQRWIEHVSLYRSAGVERLITRLQAVRRLARNLIQRPTPGPAETA